MSLIETLIKPLLDAEYERGYSAGVSAEKLVKEKEMADLEYSALLRGVEQGKEEVLKELEHMETEEISAREFEELTGMAEEPFGFVGTIDDLIGYERGYGEGVFETKCEIGEIDLPVVDDLGEALEEEE